MRRKPLPSRPAWMVEQGARCSCRGTDDLCACQNAEEPWKYGLGGSPPPSREQELERRVRELEGHVRTLELQQQTDRQTIAHLSAALRKAVAEGVAAQVEREGSRDEQNLSNERGEP